MRSHAATRRIATVDLDRFGEPAVSVQTFASGESCG
jgi:hypothetical protein